MAAGAPEINVWTVLMIILVILFAAGCAAMELRQYQKRGRK